MDRQLKPLERQEFWDLVDDDNHHNERIFKQEHEDQQFAKLQAYLNEKPLLCPISRRNCLFTTWWAGVFLPPIIASQHALQVQLTSLPAGYYAIGAGLTMISTFYEIKKLIELLKDDTNNNEDDTFEELY